MKGWSRYGHEAESVRIQMKSAEAITQLILLMSVDSFVIGSLKLAGS